MPEYKVKQGDCIESIAHKFGHLWKTLWDDSKNADLRKKRKEPNVLLPGDIVFVPDKRLKDESGQTEKRHRFRKKSGTSRIRIALEDEYDEPLADQPYIIEIDGELLSGTTDSEGRIEHSIPSTAKKGKLYIGGEQNVQYPLELGHIDPITDVSGVQSRLNNLGFDCGPPNGALNLDTKTAVKKFQQEYGLLESGKIDQQTFDKLEEVYGF